MVEKKQAVERLVAACSGFKDAWQAHREQSKGERAVDYNDLGVLAQRVVDRMDGQTCLLTFVFPRPGATRTRSIVRARVKRSSSRLSASTEGEAATDLFVVRHGPPLGGGSGR